MLEHRMIGRIKVTQWVRDSRGPECPADPMEVRRAFRERPWFKPAQRVQIIAAARGASVPWVRAVCADLLLRK